MHVQSSTIHNKPKYPPMDEWIDKWGGVPTMDCYSGIRRKKEELIHAATWMNLVSVMLSERNQSLKATYCMISFMRNVQNRQIRKDRKQISGHQRLGRQQGVTANAVTFWVMKMRRGAVDNTGNVLNATKLFTLKWLFYVYLPM